MLTVNHIITASILAFLMAFSPMSINMFHDPTPTISTIYFTAN